MCFHNVIFTFASRKQASYIVATLNCEEEIFKKLNINMVK